MYFEHPVPFYVAYPFSSFYDDEKTARKDLELMKSFYPEASRKIQQIVERECDRMEYDGSMMYDEYPDQLMVMQICRRISDKVREENGRHEIWEGKGNLNNNVRMEAGIEPELLEVQDNFRARSMPIDDLVRILFCHEMFQRRCRRRRARRYF